MLKATITVQLINHLPSVPAVYALYGGRGAHRYVGYVGISDNLKRRINHHLVQRSSSVVTGVAVASLNPDLVTEVEWWEDKSFGQSLRLAAAELVAFEVLNPALRSRQNTKKADALLEENPEFHERMKYLFEMPPCGRLIRQSLQQVVERVENVEAQLAELDGRLRRLQGDPDTR